MTSERIVRNPESSLAISARLCDRQARGFVRAHPVKVHKERTAVSAWRKTLLSASDSVGVTRVTWASDGWGSGAAVGTTSGKGSPR